MSILRNLVSPERRYYSGPFGQVYPSDRIPGPGEAGIGLSDAGAVVTEAAALSLIDFYACVALISDAIGMLPSDAFRKAGDTRSAVRPRPTLVSQPDPEMEAGEFWSCMTTSLLLRGNAYALITARDAMGHATAVKALHPDDVAPRRNRETKRWEYVLANGEVATSFDIIHVPWVRLAGQIQGLSPIACARRGLGAAIRAEEFGAGYFRDAAAPSSVLETDQELDDTGAKKVLARWTHSHAGRRRPAVLSSGLKWRAISISPEESQFLGTLGLNTTRIARLLRVPPHMIGDVVKTTSFGSGVEEMGIGFVVYTLGPHLTRFEAAWTRQLPRPQYHRFNVSALLRGNAKDRNLSYAVARQWGWMSVNDIRRLENLSPVAGGDVYLQPLNMIDAEAALTELLKPAPANTPGGPTQ